MAEDRELRNRIARCKRSLQIISHEASIEKLEGMIRADERRLAELEREPDLPGKEKAIHE